MARKPDPRDVGLDWQRDRWQAFLDRKLRTHDAVSERTIALRALDAEERAETRAALEGIRLKYAAKRAKLKAQ